MPARPEAPLSIGTSTTRRGFLAATGRAAATSSLVAFAGSAPAVHAAGSDEIRLALIGCGGRGGRIVRSMAIAQPLSGR
jgi:hypothetical protein